MRIHALLVLVAALGPVQGCQKPTPIDPDPVVASVSGTWTGTSTDPVENSQLTWTLTQDGTTVNGTSRFVGVRSGFEADGTISGTVSGSTFTFSFTLTFAVPFQFCTASASGTAQLTNNSMAGTYTGMNSCQSGPFGSAQFTASRMLTTAGAP
jgi:hypothetical protein